VHPSLVLYWVLAGSYTLCRRFIHSFSLSFSLSLFLSLSPSLSLSLSLYLSLSLSLSLFLTLPSHISKKQKPILHHHSLPIVKAQPHPCNHRSLLQSSADDLPLPLPQTIDNLLVRCLKLPFASFRAAHHWSPGVLPSCVSFCTPWLFHHRSFQRSTHSHKAGITLTGIWHGGPAQLEHLAHTTTLQMQVRTVHSDLRFLKNRVLFGYYQGNQTA